jgi:hypothetical protein
MRKLFQTGLVCFLAGCCFAQTPALKVLPWNGYRAAVSLTFDDAETIQLNRVIPDLNKRHLRGTFSLTVSKLTRLDEWRKAERHSLSSSTPPAPLRFFRWFWKSRRGVDQSGLFKAHYAMRVVQGRQTAWVHVTFRGRQTA